ncbi:MAG TPA: TetR/AcrR family transcriptional regulator [Chloroflexota bacterium]|nr:TetR/AcrR family transcriptional regulator [Chloroflexota bacterium]
MAIGQVNANDPRVKRTRQLLQQTLLDLMREKSFAAITVHDLAERSTLNRATFYAHFEDKYDLLDSIMREGVEQALAGILPDAAPLTAQTLRTLCQAVFTYLAQIQDRCEARRRLLEPMLEKAAQEVLHGFMVRWLQRVPPASLPGGASTETVASVVSWAIFGAASQWSRAPWAQSVDEAAAQVATVLIDGVAAAIAPA